MDYYGTENVITTQSHRIGEDGIGTYQVTVSRKEQLIPMPSIGAGPAALLPSGYMYGVTLYALTDCDQRQLPDGTFEVSMTFKGIGQDGITLVTVDGGTSDETIQHHPDFPTWAGTPTAPKFSQAYWELLQQGTDTDPNEKSDIYKFNGFKQDADNGLGKVDSFITGAYTIQLTDLVTSSSGVESEVTIGIPSVSGWSFSGSYLHESTSIEKHGSAYRRTRRYRRSGPVAWNSSIYATA